MTNEFLISYSGARFKNSQDDVGDFRLDKKLEYEIQFDQVSPLTVLTFVGKFLTILWLIIYD